MKEKTTSQLIIPACFLAATLFFVCGAAAAPVTENECIHGGGYVTEGSGCKFCVGGKLDMAEIKDSEKKTPPRADSEKKSGERTSESGDNNSGGN